MSAHDLRRLIRPLKEQRRARDGRRRQAPPEPSRALRGIEAMEAIQARIVPLLGALQGECPQLTLHRRFYDGAWEVGLSADLPRREGKGRDAHAYSRIVFEIRVKGEDGALASVACHATAFDRDEPSARVAVADVADLDEVERFAEEACLTFARDFYAAAPASAG